MNTTDRYFRHVHGNSCFAKFLSRGVAITGVFMLVGTLVAQSHDYMNAISARFEGHANGHFTYERRVYLTTEVPITEIKESNGIVDKWATTSTLKLWDSNELFWENTLGYRRHRNDAVNKLNAASGLAGMDAVFKDYSRLQIKDTKKNQDILAYRIKGTSDFAHILRNSSKANISADPREIYSGGMEPHFMLFSQFVYWEGWSKWFSPVTSIVGDGKIHKVELKRDEEYYSILVEPSTQTITSYEYRPESGIPSMGSVPLLRASYEDYDMAGAEIYPRKVRFQFYEGLGKGSEARRYTHMNATTIEMQVTSLEFDKPEFSEKIEFPEISGQRVEDHRFGSREPIFYEASPDQTDKDILGMKKR